MKIKGLNYLFIFIFTSVFIISCSEDNKNEDSDNKNDNSQNSSIDTTDTDSDDYEFIPPSPLQIASIFKKAGLEYMQGLPNSTENADDYNSKFQQSLNFGVYSSDLAYCVENEKYDEASQYLKVIRKLGSKIGLETVFQN